MTTKPNAPKPRHKNDKRRDLIIGAVITLVIGIVLATGFPWWFKYFESNGSNSAIVGFTGGSASFTVYSENRWSPVGTGSEPLPMCSPPERAASLPTRRSR